MSDNGWSRSDSFSVIAIAVSVFALLLSHSASTEANNLSGKALDITPAKDAFVEYRLSNYHRGLAFRDLDNVLEDIELDRPTNIGFNIINTGQIDTGEIMVLEEGNDRSFGFKNIEIGNVEDGEGNSFWIPLDVHDESDLLGIHVIPIRIVCPNCFSQDIVVITNVSVCVYEDPQRDC